MGGLVCDGSEHEPRKKSQLSFHNPEQNVIEERIDFFQAIVLDQKRAEIVKNCSFMLPSVSFVNAKLRLKTTGGAQPFGKNTGRNEVQEVANNEGRFELVVREGDGPRVGSTACRWGVTKDPASV